MSTSDQFESDGQTVHPLEFELESVLADGRARHEKIMPAPTTHTPFYVIGLRNPRIPALTHSDFGFRRGGTRSSKNRFGS